MVLLLVRKRWRRSRPLYGRRVLYIIARKLPLLSRRAPEIEPSRKRQLPLFIWKVLRNTCLVMGFTAVFTQQLPSRSWVLLSALKFTMIPLNPLRSLGVTTDKMTVLQPAMYTLTLSLPCSTQRLALPLPTMDWKPLGPNFARPAPLPTSLKSWDTCRIIDAWLEYFSSLVGNVFRGRGNGRFLRYCLLRRSCSLGNGCFWFRKHGRDKVCNKRPAWE